MCPLPRVVLSAVWGGRRQGAEPALFFCLFMLLPLRPNLLTLKCCRGGERERGAVINKLFLTQYQTGPAVSLARRLNQGLGWSMPRQNLTKHTYKDTFLALALALARTLGLRLRAFLVLVLFLLFFIFIFLDPERCPRLLP